jgi:beta-glucosidase/6-phospho-beta-glucosidase/beta-galactosidase
LECCDRHGIIPSVTLHHFTHPQWFEDLGGFANKDNIQHFVNYSITVFTHFGTRITHWATFNEPNCFSFCGYIMGIWAPGQKLGLKRAGTVLGNMLKAHVASYKALKNLPGGPEARIGMVMQHIRFVPRATWLSRLWVR